MAKTIFTPEHRRLVALLRQLRKDAGLRQADLAERLGRPQSFVSKYESCERRLDFIELQAICSVLNVSLASFVREFEKSQGSAGQGTHGAEYG